jgi:hypothetical protein
LTDLTFIEDGTPDELPGGLINFVKRRMLAQVRPPPQGQFYYLISRQVVVIHGGLYDGDDRLSGRSSSISRAPLILLRYQPSRRSSRTPRSFPRTSPTNAPSVRPPPLRYPGAIRTTFLCIAPTVAMKKNVEIVPRGMQPISQKQIKEARTRYKKIVRDGKPSKKEVRLSLLSAFGPSPIH